MLLFRCAIREQYILMLPPLSDFRRGFFILKDDFLTPPCFY